MKLDRWNEDTHGSLTEKNVRARYRESLHRVYRRDFDEGASFAGSAAERILIVLEGSFTMTWGSRTERASAGDVLEVPGGPFTFRCDAPVSFMAVYRLPAEMWPN